MTIVLTRHDIARLMRPRDYLDAVEAAFVASIQGRASAPPPLHLHGLGGGIHAKGATLADGRTYGAIKLNANFPGNPSRGLPTIQGVIALFDMENGALLALMDSIEITLRRTAAATALAARSLARREAVTLTVCGCGGQALAQIEALSGVIAIAQAYLFDIDAAKSQALADRAEFGFPIEAVSDFLGAARESDLIVTCTTARMPFLDVAHIRPGTFIAAIGADNPEKGEITPNLMARAKVVVDSLDQCAVMGDLHHAIDAGVMTRNDVHASLADIITNTAAGRPDATDVIVFDSTGTALQDVASAALAYERAAATGVTGHVELNSIHGDFDAGNLG